MNQLITLVTFLVIYEKDPKIMYQHLQNIQHMSIIYKTYLYLQVFLIVNKRRVIIQYIILSTILKERRKI